MRCEVEYTEEFEKWWDELDEDAQVAVAAYVALLEEHGVGLGFPYSSDIKDGIPFSNERTSARLQGYSISGAVCLRPPAILLLGGDKTGNPRWYDEFVPIADELFNAHLKNLKKEGLIDD